MEEKILKGMMIRFFDAELTAEEERELCCWLRENDVPAELRKDKETIIALCAEPIVAELPKGAVQRLEAMLDGLEESKVYLNADDPAYSGRKRRVLKLPRAVATGAVAAAVAFLVYIVFQNKDVTQGAGITLPADPAVSQLQVTESPQEYILDDTEEDTFDNPEDAIRCFKNAYGNVMIAIHTAQDNTKEIESRLEEAFTLYKDIIKIKM